MAWTLTPKNNFVIVTMNSNKVNKLNPEFFQDFHKAFDELDQNYPRQPIILISQSQKVFSAGIDFDYSFSLFQTQDQKKIWEWFQQFNTMILRLFNAERMTVAAINGHVYAGGLILALCCDFRVGLQGNSRYSLNEVPIGIPMPSVYTEIIRHRLGNHYANESILLGSVYSAKEALDKHFIQHLAHSMEDLHTTCAELAQKIHPDAWPAYIQSKKMLNFPVMERVEKNSLEFDKTQSCKIISCDESLKRHKDTLHALMAKTGKT